MVARVVIAMSVLLSQVRPTFAIRYASLPVEVRWIGATRSEGIPSPRYSRTLAGGSDCRSSAGEIPLVTLSKTPRRNTRLQGRADVHQSIMFWCLVCTYLVEGDIGTEKGGGSHVEMRRNWQVM